MAASPEQLHELLTYCLDFARTMLEKAGEFHPFGVTLSQDGKVAAVGGYNGEEHPKALEISIRGHSNVRWLLTAFGHSHGKPYSASDFVRIQCAHRDLLSTLK